MSTIFNKPQVVVPGTSNGLVSLNGVPGNTTGNAIASGYVGQSVTGTLVTLTPSSAVWVATSTSSITLQPGIWLLWTNYQSQITTAAEERFGIATNGNNDSSGILTAPFFDVAKPASTYGVTLTTGPTVVTLANSQSYWGKMFLQSGTSVAGTQFQMFAVRIA